MSYCRCDGITSDVYVWSDGEIYHVWLHDGGSDPDECFPDFPIRWRAANLRSLRFLLVMIKAAGFKVPDDVFKRIKGEMRKEQV